MRSSGGEHATAGSITSPTDTGLRCPRCEYNLTGLIEARCPECGTAVSWEAVRAAAERRPAIAFERARGWRILPAFSVTLVTVLFAPWIFARQAVRRIHVGRAMIFAAACYLPVTGRCAMEGFDPSFYAWITTAAIYLVLQAILLTAIDPTSWRRPHLGLVFWLAIGGYTTAVVVTECVHGVPLVSLADFGRQLGELLRGTVDAHAIARLVEAERRWVGWLQLGVWLAGLACCYVVRLRKRRVPLVLIVPLAVLCVFVLFGLYGFCTEVIGYRLFEYFHRFYAN